MEYKVGDVNGACIKFYRFKETIYYRIPAVHILNAKDKEPHGDD